MPSSEKSAGWTDFQRNRDDGQPVKSGTIDPLEVLDAVDIPILVLHPDLSVAGFNRAAANVLGLVPSNIDRSVHELSALTGLRNLEASCSQVIATGMPSRHDFRYADKSFVVRIAPSTQSDRTIGGTLLSFTNVTAFRASLDQAIYEREFTKAILNTVADPLVVLSDDLRVQTANRAFFGYFRVSRETTQNVSFCALANHAFDRIDLRKQLHEMLAANCEFQPLEIDLDLPGHGYRTLVLNARPLSLPGGSGGLILLSLQDVTARKEAEEAVRRSESNLRDFIENASVALHWVGPDGIILWANQTELDLLGYAPEEYIGHQIAEFHVDQPVIKDILRRLTSHETLHECEARLRCKDGSIRHVLIDSNVLWEGDKFVHTRCFTRDITERKRTEEQIAILAREAEHRAKNVLATVQATVHLAQSDTPDGLKRAIEGRIQALANVHRLFVESHWMGASLHDLVTQELSPYRLDGSKCVRISGPEVLMEPSMAQTIAVTMHELATNAAKYGALSVPDGQVQVEWSRAADGRLALRWIEMDGPRVEPPTHQGFGTKVVESILRVQHNGEVRFDWRPEGLACDIVLTAGDR